jgi:plasmid stability protein
VTELRIRNVEDWIVETFRTMAKQNGRSMEAEIKELLRKSALHPREELAKELKAMNRELQEKYGLFSDSANLIREDRDERG